LALFDTQFDQICTKLSERFCPVTLLFDDNPPELGRPCLALRLSFKLGAEHPAKMKIASPGFGPDSKRGPRLVMRYRPPVWAGPKKF
jgi:hypothetical protein